MGDSGPCQRMVTTTWTIKATNCSSLISSWEERYMDQESTCLAALITGICTNHTRLFTSKTLNCTVLYCTVVYYIVLCSTSTLHYIILYCIVLLCTVLYCLITLQYNVLDYTIHHCIALIDIVYHCTLYYITVYYCTLLYTTVLYCHPLAIIYLNYQGTE